MEVRSSTSSARLMVLTPSAAARARSPADHLTIARAALIWAPESDFIARLTSLPKWVICAHMGNLCPPIGVFGNSSGRESELAFEPKSPVNRRAYIGGSDARIVMGQDEPALLRLWREKRGEVEPKDLSGNLIVQLGVPQPELVRAEHPTNPPGCPVPDPASGDPMDGRDPRRGGGRDRGRLRSQVHAAWSFSEEGAVEKHMAQLQHNMWVTNAKMSVLSIITGGGKWVEIAIAVDSLYQHLLLTAEKKFWRCVESGEPPRLFGVEPPRARIEAVRVVDMSQSNSWAEFAGTFLRTREAYAEHERAKAELKALVPEDAREASGHGIRARRSKAGAISFDVLEPEVAHAPVQ